ncbi:hypothetical protein D3C83_330970 [compost metagenome]
MCMIELVDYNENLLAEKAPKKAAKTTRRRSGAKKKAAPKAESAQKDETAGDAE